MDTTDLLDESDGTNDPDSDTDARQNSRARADPDAEADQAELDQKRDDNQSGLDSQTASEVIAGSSNDERTSVATAKNIMAGVRYYVVGIAKLFDEKQVLLCSQAVAFKVLITFVPIVVLLLGFIGRVLARDRPYNAVRDFVTGYLPSYDAQRLIEFADQLQRVSLSFTILGSIAMLYVAITLFSTLRSVLAIVFQDDWHAHRRKLKGLLFDARMAAQVGVLFVLTVAMTAFVHSLDAIGLSVLGRIGVEPDWLRSGWIQFVRYLSYFVPLLLSIGMFFQLYHYVPIPRPPRRSVFAGALIAAALWEIGKTVFTRYATSVGRINAWLPELDNERLFAIGDTFAIVVSFVVWAYLSGLILMLGALVALLHERRYRANQTENGVLNSD